MHNSQRVLYTVARTLKCPWRTTTYVPDPNPDIDPDSNAPLMIDGLVPPIFSYVWLFDSHRIGANYLDGTFEVSLESFSE